MKVLLFETVTGKPVMDLQVSNWSYDTGILAADEIDITVPAYTKWAESLDLRTLLTRDKHSIALVNEEVQGVRIVEAAGPIVIASPAEDPDGNHAYEVSCYGIERLLEWRRIRKFPGWPLIGPDLRPTGLYDQNLSGMSYGTIMKHLLVESEKFPGGKLPMVYEPDRAGNHERSAYAAIDGKPVLDAFDQVAELADGVEYDFQPFIDAYDNIKYKLVTGTDQDRVISGSTTKVWNLGGAGTNIRRYERVPDSRPVITDSVFSGGKENDTVMLAASKDHTTIPLGYPKAEVWDSSHSTVSVQATLQSWADGALGSLPDQVSFDVRVEEAYGVRHGDYAQIASDGHWDLPNGEYNVRVLSVSRSSTEPDWLRISLV